MESIMTQRLRGVADYLRATERVYNYEDFYRKLGKNRSQMCDTMRGRRRVTHELADLISEVFPEINDLYLKDVECKTMTVPLIDPPIEVTQPTPMMPHGFAASEQSVEHQSDDNMARLLAIIEKQQEQIDTLIKMLSSK